MTIAAYRDRITGAYPISLDTIRAQAGVLFGEEPPQEVLDAAGMDPVEAITAPAYDPATQTIAEGVPVLGGDAWAQTWVVTALPPAPLGSISYRQFFQALALPPYSMISTQEALDAVKTGEVPQVMQTVIDGLPIADQFAATMLVAGATEFQRTNRMVEVFGASKGMDAAAIDTFWRFAQGL